MQAMRTGGKWGGWGSTRELRRRLFHHPCRRNRLRPRLRTLAPIGARWGAWGSTALQVCRLRSQRNSLGHRCPRRRAGLLGPFRRPTSTLSARRRLTRPPSSVAQIQLWLRRPAGCRARGSGPTTRCSRRPCLRLGLQGPVLVVVHLDRRCRHRCQAKGRPG